MLLFTSQCYGSAVYAMGLCLSVSPPVTSQSSAKMAKCRIVLTGTLIFWR